MEYVFTRIFLVLLQAVLGFGNLLYISLESKRVTPEKQAYVRKLGIGLAIALRIALLFLVVALFKTLKEPMFGIEWKDVVEGRFNVQSLVELFGGGFILYTAIKEIFHMLHIHQDDAKESKKERSVGSAVFWIVFMNVIFSFDSILSAMALTDVTWLIATAIVISGAMMILLADHVSTFLQKNRMYEVLGLFILFIVGIMLITEGAHKAHVTLFTNPVTPMTKTTFYFVIFVLVVTDLVQSRYQKKILALDSARHKAKNPEATA